MATQEKVMASSLQFVLNEMVYHSRTLVPQGRESFLSKGKGIFYIHYPSAEDLSNIGPGNVMPLVYLPYEEAKKIDYFAVIPLLEAYNPLFEVVVVVACVYSPSRNDTIFKGQVITINSYKTIPEIMDPNGQIVKGSCELTEETDKYVRAAMEHCNNCGKLKDEVERLQKCANCKSARYCSKECQKTDWKRHKKRCTFTKSLRKDGQHMKKHVPKKTS
ncbi:expressed unknown protein [Seminavis robusta]|uniref:MYND-type domain-containing protein n=1 Tax=Seminavis robusta TaxID=568900 RepID=A0A9N8DIX8_9STRA|nr:expressed unknown protein [Seminavis robusta]|eukprot:Sro110_g054940.1 n/a (218) ;mRNA; r:72045-72798